MEQIMSIICTVGAFLLLLLIGYLRMAGQRQRVAALGSNAGRAVLRQRHRCAEIAIRLRFSSRGISTHQVPGAICRI